MAMSGGAVTTNPLLIMVINMTIVFGVLFLLGYVIEFIHYIDPTKKKAKKSNSVNEGKQSAKQEEIKAAEQAEKELEEKTLVAVITAAIMAYGYKDIRIKTIKRL